MMNKIPNTLILVVISSGLAGCGGTGGFIDQPSLSISDAAVGRQQAVAQLFDGAQPYKIKLCTADQSSRKCKPNQGLSASGVGGPFLPLSMNVAALDIKSIKPAADGFAFSSQVDATVDAIPPLCGTVGGTIKTGTNTASVQLNNFYCNWAVIGNVSASMKLSIDNIDLSDKTFSGYYRITFYGTGNASGSGYFKGALAKQPS